MKESISRTVELVHSDGAPSRVVKRFSSTGWLASFFDRRRARREFKLLAALRALRLPVPAPLELRRVPSGFEIVMEWLAGTVNLAEILRGTEPWPAPPSLVVLELGSMLAEFHASGLDHPDLHPGNVLIDRVGRPYLVDFHKAALRESMPSRLLVRDLVTICASVRESIHARLRSRFFLSWLAALPMELRSSLPPRLELVRYVEVEARGKRRSVVRRRSRRWLRKSRDCARILQEKGETFQRAELSTRFAREVMDLLGAKRFPMSSGPTRVAIELPFQAVGFPRALVMTGVSRSELRATWLNMVRLEEHAIPSARPLCFFRGRSPWAAFELLPGEQQCLELPEPLRQQVLARSLPDLRAALADRLLAIRAFGAEHLLVSSQGKARIAPTKALVGIASATPGRPDEPLQGVRADPTV